jgi:hypothetical protein
MWVHNLRNWNHFDWYYLMNKNVSCALRILAMLIFFERVSHRNRALDLLSVIFQNYSLMENDTGSHLDYAVAGWRRAFGIVMDWDETECARTRMFANFDHLGFVDHGTRKYNEANVLLRSGRHHPQIATLMAIITPLIPSGWYPRRSFGPWWSVSVMGTVDVFFIFQWDSGIRK